MSVTRERIMELAEDLILTKGYNSFSYQDISSSMGIKNAAIHYYFPSKENLGASIIKMNIQRFDEMTGNMKELGFDEWQQLESFIKLYHKSNREGKICLIGSLGTDFNTLSSSMQEELSTMIEKILHWLTDILKEGKAKGQFSFEEEPRLKAGLILSNLMAGVQLSRAMHKSDFRAIHQSILEGLKS